MRGKLFGSLNSCTRLRLLWHIFTFANTLASGSTRKGTPRSQYCIWTVRTRSKKDEPERTASQIAHVFASRLRSATQRYDFRRMTAAGRRDVHHAFPRQRSATSRKGAHLFITVPLGISCPRRSICFRHKHRCSRSATGGVGALYGYRPHRTQEVSRDETSERSFGNRQRTSIVRWCFLAVLRASRGGPERRVIPRSL